jgi:hypothetical protein
MKKKLMELNKTDQFLHECMTWERLLDFFKQENSFLKTRLSEVLDHKTEKDFLALAEHFQNQFILKDEFIDEMVHDAREQQKNLDGLTIKKIDLEEKLIKKQQKLRNEMAYLEKDFITIKNEFNQYLTSKL